MSAGGGSISAMGGVVAGGSSSPRGGASHGNSSYPMVMGGGAIGLPSTSSPYNNLGLTIGPTMIQDQNYAVESLYEAKIDDGRLLYDRKWFVMLYIATLYYFN